MSALDPVLVGVHGPVATVTLNRPHARNAIDGATARALAAHLADLDAADAVRVIVLTGADGTFCAGMDLKAFARGERPSVPGSGFAGLVERPPSTPLIAAVEGWALAGGFEIALACDLVVAAEDARFGLPEVRRGLVAGAGGLLRLAKAIPYALAMELALTGRPLPAPDAARLGLVNAVVAPGQALARAVALAAEIAANGPLAVRTTKAILAASVEWMSAEAFAAQRPLVDRVLASADAAEGIRAFRERRPPVWRGA